MKKFYMLLFILTLSQIAQGQEFSFQMYFEDSAGNKDSLTIGYDINATDSIDAAFGETNIISTPLSVGLDVRVTNEWPNRAMNPSTDGTFHTKKQIIKKYYYNGCGFNLVNIDIYTNYWPVITTWDNSQFNNSCRNGSFFTSDNPGGWWDIISPSNLYKADFKFTSQATFTSNYDQYTSNYYSYINSSNDTISFFWLLFGDSTSGVTAINKPGSQEDIKIFPNPTASQLNIQPADPNLTIEAIQLFDLAGKEQLIELTGDMVNLEGISDGMYFMQLTMQGGQTVMKKIIKK
jgi:hypothetical protein